MSNLSDFIKAVNEDIVVTQNKFIYYEAATGNIIKISNRSEDTDYSILEIDSKSVLDIFTGDKKLSQFRVEYDLTLKCKSLVEICDSADILSLTDRFFKIPKKTEGNFDITIVQNFKNKEWKITIDNSLLHMIHTEVFNHKKILLSITSENDPNIVYRTLNVDLNELLTAQSLSYPFQYESEKHYNNVSIYTPKYFNTYSHEVIYE